jgi:hypothetical protein
VSLSVDPRHGESRVYFFYCATTASDPPARLGYFSLHVTCAALGARGPPGSDEIIVQDLLVALP